MTMASSGRSNAEDAFRKGKARRTDINVLNTWSTARNKELNLSMLPVSTKMQLMVVENGKAVSATKKYNVIDTVSLRQAGFAMASPTNANYMNVFSKAPAIYFKLSQLNKVGKKEAKEAGAVFLNGRSMHFGLNDTVALVHASGMMGSTDKDEIVRHFEKFMFVAQHTIKFAKPTNQVDDCFLGLPENTFLPIKFGKRKTKDGTGFMVGYRVANTLMNGNTNGHLMVLPTNAEADAAAKQAGLPMVGSCYQMPSNLMMTGSDYVVDVPKIKVPIAQPYRDFSWVDWTVDFESPDMMGVGVTTKKDGMVYLTTREGLAASLDDWLFGT